MRTVDTFIPTYYVLLDGYNICVEFPSNDVCPDILMT